MRGRTGMACALALACGSEAGAPDAGAPDAPPPDAGPQATAVAVYGASHDFGAQPFPSDRHLDAQGRLSLTSLPVPDGAEPAIVQAILDSAAWLDGASSTPNVYFPIDGAIDPTTLPGNVTLAGLDDLEPIAIDVVWREDLGVIVAALPLGTALEPGRRHAAWLTDGVLATDGTPVGASPAFEAERSADLAELYDALPPDVAARVVSATLFRTHTRGPELRAMRDVVAASPPAAAVLSVIGPDAASLDAVFGVQDPAAEPGNSWWGPRAQPHGNVAALVHGTLQLTSFLAATDATPGLIAFDAGGQPVVRGSFPVAFTLVLPVAASYDDLPVVLFAHGIERARSDMLVQADALAARGLALLAVDLPYHGDRMPVPSDASTAMTGAPVPDGFGDSGGLTSSALFMHFGGAGPPPGPHPGVMRDHFRQAAIDLCSLVAFARGGDPAPINAALAAAGLPADLRFRAGTAGFVGDSFGSFVGMIAFAVEPDLDAGAFAATPAGFMFPTAMYSPTYNGFARLVLLEPLAMNDRIVPGDPLLDARFEPVVDVIDYGIEPGDAAGYAAGLRTGALRGGDVPNLLMHAAWSDEFVPNQATEHLAALLGVPRAVLALPAPAPAPAVRYAPVPDVAAPLSGNATGGTRTQALAQWHPASHGIINFMEQESRYEPGFPPFVLRADEVPVDNYTREAIGMHADFLADHFAGAVPTLRDPFAP